MRRALLPLILLTVSATAQKPFTLQQVLSAPYALQLSAAPVGDTFAWIENAEGRRNIWIAGPHTPARQITHYTQDDAQDINQLAWSPDGRAIAYTYGAEDGADGHPANPAHLQHPVPLEIILQPLAPNAQPTTLGEGTHPLFTRDGQAVLFLRAGQIWTICTTGCPGSGPSEPGSTASSGPHQLVYDRGSASSLTLSPDGQTLAYISNRREPDNPSHSFLALFHLATHELTFPAPSTSDDSAPTFSPDGQQIAWLRAPFTRQPEYTPHLTSPNPWSIQLLDLATSTTRQIYQPEANKPGSVLPHIADSSPYLLFASTQRLIFYSEADGWTHLYSIDPMDRDASPRLLTTGEDEIEDAALNAAHTRLIYASNSMGAIAYAGPAAAIGETFQRAASEAKDRMRLWLLDLGKQVKPGPLLDFFGDSIAAHPVFAGDTAAALVSDANTPMHPALITLEGARSLHPNANPTDYPATNLVTPTQILIPSTDNLTLHAQLFLPPHLDPHTKHATLIFVHGGPNRQMLLGYPGMDYYSNAYAMNQYLCSQGFIVLSVNYRGGTGYGLAFREAAHYGPDGASEYNDVLAAQKYLTSRPDVDPARIGIWGGSYGGYLTALALARNSNLFAAGVDFHGIHEWYLEGNPERWMTDPDHATSAQKDAAAALAHASSPMADIDHWRSPVLLIHGDNDPEVAYAQTPTLADALRARHIPVEELIFPDEVHGFLLHKDWLAAYQATADFFIHTLKP